MQATETPLPIDTWTIDGRDKSGKPEQTRIILLEDRSDPDGDPFAIDIEVAGEVIDCESFETLEGARERAEALRTIHADDYAIADEARSGERFNRLVNVADEWHPDPDRELVHAIAQAVLDGRSAEFLATLKSAGLV